ncbi:MAG: DUF3445 domain-containing protein [Acidimicrobiales bacterium]|nr:DUF3445 domain-containing protein [Acidimicrobiales bacterium]
MGLKPLDLDDWIQVGPERDEELALKRELLATRHDEVVGTLPGSEAASREVLDALVEHLARRFPELVVEVPEVDGEGRPLHPIDAAGRLVQEDLCLHTPAADSAPVLVAASVCFPSRWRLAEKMGLPIRAIHGPVASYDEQLGSPVDRVLAKLEPGKGVSRLNWSLLDDGALFQPTGHGRTERNEAVTPANAGDLLWLRVERQTLRRFPRHRSLLFTIRTYQRPLRSLEGQPGAAARLAGTIRNLPEDTARYKSLPAFSAAALAYLDRLAAA